MIVAKFPLTPFQQNTRIVACEKTKRRSASIPASGSAELVDFINDNGLTLQAITLTHGHLDHVGGTTDLAKSFPDAEILLHKDDEDLYYGLPQQPLMMGMPVIAARCPRICIRRSAKIDQKLGSTARSMRSVNFGSRSVIAPAIHAGTWYLQKKRRSRYSSAIACFRARSAAPIYRAAITTH